MVIVGFLKKHFFTILVLFAGFINLPFFLNKTPIYHDTLAHYIAFYNTYNSFFFHAELPRWLPYTSFGVSSDFFIFLPTDYFFMLVGSLLKIINVLFLYKASFFATQLIYLLGTYTLARDIFKSRFSIWLVCLCAAGSLMLRDQIGWGFSYFYLLPWMLFYFRKLIIDKNPFPFFFLSVISLLGCLPYFTVIVFFQFFVFFILLWIVNRRQIFCGYKAPCKSSVLINIIKCLGLFAFVFAYFYILFHSKDLIQILSVGRDPESFGVSLQTFLSYGGHIGLKKFIFFITPIHLATSFSDLHIYLGLTLWICVVYGIFRSKEPLFAVFFVLAAVVFLFSLGSYFSVFCYYFMPGMKLFRHIGLTANLLRFYVPILAGFGLQALLNDIAKQKDNNQSYLFLFFGVFMVAFSFLVVCPGESLLWAVAYPCLILAIVLFAFFFAQLRKTKSPHLGVLLVLFCVLELVVAQFLIAERVHKNAPAQPKSLSYVSRNLYQSSRSSKPPSIRAKELKDYLSFFHHRWGCGIYAYYYDFLQWDPCDCDLRLDFMNKYVYDFLKITGNKPTLQGFTLPESSFVRNAVGCQTPKIQLISKVIFSNDPKTTLKAIKTKDAIVVAGASTKLQNTWKNHAKSEGYIVVNDFSSNRLKLTAFVPERQGAWLYYKDGYHPDWTAKINNQRSVVYQANIAFKAIKLPYGLNSVELSFDNRKMALCF